MAWLYTKNMPQSTLASGYTAGDSTLVVTDASKFDAPGSGDTIMLAIGSPPQFWLRATAVSSNTFTVDTTGAEGSTTANVGSGAVIAQVITAGVLQALLSAAGSAIGLNIQSASGLGCVLDCDLSTGARIGGGTATDNTSTIQAYLDTATATTPVCLILDGPSLVTGLEIPAVGYVSIISFSLTCGFYLKSSSSAAALHSDRPGSIPGSRGKNIYFSGFTINGNLSGNTTLTCISISNIDNVVIRDVRITNSSYFGIMLENCGNVLVDNARIDGSNTVHQDGVHLLGPCEDVRIANCSFESLGDDAVAINAPEGYGGNISRVVVVNCIFDSTLTLSRIYSNASGSTHTVDNVQFVNCTCNLLNSIGVASGVGFRIGDGRGGTAQDWVRHVALTNVRVTGVGFMYMSDHCGDITLTNCAWGVQGTPLAHSQPAISFEATGVIVQHLSIHNFSLYTDIPSITTYPPASLVSTAAGCVIDRLDINGASNPHAQENGGVSPQPYLIICDDGTINHLSVNGVDPTIVVLASDFSNIGSISGSSCANYSMPDAVASVGTVYQSSDASDAVSLMTASGAVRLEKAVTHASALTADLPVFGDGAGAAKAGTRSGNTTKVATVSGSFTAGNAVMSDASGNVVDAGTTPGGGTGGGTVTHASGALTNDLPVFGNSGDDAKVGTRSGNTTEVATVSGSKVAGNTVQWDADGNLVDAGVTPGSGGGGGGGELVLLESHTASSSSSLDFTAFVDSNYSAYVVEFDDVAPATTGANFLMRMGAGSFDTGSNYQWIGMYIGVGDSLTAIGASPDSSIRIAQSVSNTAVSGNWKLNGSWKLGDLGSAFVKAGSGVVSTPVGSGNMYQWTLSGMWNNTSAADRIQFFFSSGNIANGTIRIYGIKNTSSGGSTGVIGTALFSLSGGSVSGAVYGGCVASVVRNNSGRFTVNLSPSQQDFTIALAASEAGSGAQIFIASSADFHTSPVSSFDAVILNAAGSSFVDSGQVTITLFKM